jgi:hypothetical protein
VCGGWLWGAGITFVLGLFAFNLLVPIAIALAFAKDGASFVHVVLLIPILVSLAFGSFIVLKADRLGGIACMIGAISPPVVAILFGLALPPRCNVVERASSATGATSELVRMVQGISNLACLWH